MKNFILKRFLVITILQNFVLKDFFNFILDLYMELYFHYNIPKLLFLINN